MWQDSQHPTVCNQNNRGAAGAVCMRRRHSGSVAVGEKGHGDRHTDCNMAGPWWRSPVGPHALCSKAAAARQPGCLLSADPAATPRRPMTCSSVTRWVSEKARRRVLHTPLRCARASWAPGCSIQRCLTPGNGSDAWCAVSLPLPHCERRTDMGEWGLWVP